MVKAYLRLRNKAYEVQAVRLEPTASSSVNRDEDCNKCHYPLVINQREALEEAVEALWLKFFTTNSKDGILQDCGLVVL